MNENTIKNFSNADWIVQNPFEKLSIIANQMTIDEEIGRECLIRLLEHRSLLPDYDNIIDNLIQRAGLYPYLNEGIRDMSTAELLAIEFHRPEGMDDIILHSMQSKVYRALIDGANVILSAPTSFGKSLLIDAMVATRRYSTVVIIVPTIALIDETRRRLSRRFSEEFKIITHPGQATRNKNIYVLTQERFVELTEVVVPDFFVIDEFYKLSPSRGDERTFVLNHAFYKLLKSNAQFMMIGPNIRDITIDHQQLNFRYFGTDFKTVATEIEYSQISDYKKAAIGICRNLVDPTLIFCKSSTSAYQLANLLIEQGVASPNPKLSEFAEWLRQNYHPDWILPALLENGIGVHHGSLPRSVAYHMLRKFNEGELRYLLCTSTIIEGVNTSAKTIIIYDNKIATKNFDLFTFNNIKGRAGRMFKHFVGHVHVLHFDPQEELPLVDIPSISQPNNAPESLLIQLDESDLSEESKERLRYLHAQNILPIDIIKSNYGIPPEAQIEIAQEIEQNLQRYHTVLSWQGFPSSDQLYTVCILIFDYLMEKIGKDGVFSGKQLHYKISRMANLKTIRKLVIAEIESNGEKKDISKAIEEVLQFLRRWGENHFPRYLTALGNIQKAVFERNGLLPGDYSVYATTVKKLFMPLAATVLEEYGLPYQLSLKMNSFSPMGEDVDSIVRHLRVIDYDTKDFTDFERELLMDAISNA